MSPQQVRNKWNNLPWCKLEKRLFKLQKRIYQASLDQDNKKVHKLQKLLLHSKGAKLLATRKITQENRGKRTAGIDGKASLKEEERLILAQSLNLREKAQPLRRLWISKEGKTKEKRPLGIPTIGDRARQTLLKMALEPQWEAKFEPNTYGFRPGRSTHDAIEAIFIALAGKSTYVLDADILGCFDQINHESLLRKLETTPTMRKIIKGWLKAGIMEAGERKTTERGTPQGGCLSPLLACIALHGLESHIKEKLREDLFRHRKIKDKDTSYRASQTTISIIFYADDFLILHENLAIIEKSKVLVEEWLKEMGLELKLSKTRITHSLEGDKPGFDFLGFHIRQHPLKKKGKKSAHKTLTKPSKEAIKRQGNLLKKELRKMRLCTQEVVIKKLNPLIRGWSNYYKTGVSSQIFKSLDHLLFRKLWKWAVYRHPKKPKRWIKRKYFRMYWGNNWTFMTSAGTRLRDHLECRIERHIKVRGSKSPYDGDWIYSNLFLILHLN